MRRIIDYSRGSTSATSLLRCMITGHDRFTDGLILSITVHDDLRALLDTHNVTPGVREAAQEAELPKGASMSMVSGKGYVRITKIYFSGTQGYICDQDLSPGSVIRRRLCSTDKVHTKYCTKHESTMSASKSFTLNALILNGRRNFDLPAVNRQHYWLHRSGRERQTTKPRKIAVSRERRGRDSIHAVLAGCPSQCPRYSLLRQASQQGVAASPVGLLCCPSREGLRRMRQWFHSHSLSA